MFFFGFWPNEIAVGVDTLTYVDIGSDNEAGGNLTRPKTKKNINPPDPCPKRRPPPHATFRRRTHTFRNQGGKSRTIAG
jgi:hypothetical protein